MLNLGAGTSRSNINHRSFQRAGIAAPVPWQDSWFLVGFERMGLSTSFARTTDKKELWKRFRFARALVLALALPTVCCLGIEPAHSQLAAPPPLPSKPALKPEPTAAPETSGAGESGANPSNKEKELLERIRKLKAPRWRSFGPCRYDWSAWRLSEGDVRSTAVECGEPPVQASVAVHCPSLKLTRRTGSGAWEDWRLPLSADESKTVGGEDRMIAALCANAKPAAGAATVTPPKTPPATGGSAKPKPKGP
jgi:hypothetical protein